MPGVAWFCTTVLGILASMFLSHFIPEAGVIIAIATMGAFIIYTVENKDKDKK